MLCGSFVSSLRDSDHMARSENSPLSVKLVDDQRKQKHVAGFYIILFPILIVVNVYLRA